MKIVLVEDETMARTGICAMLREYTKHTLCGVASNGQQGYELITEYRPDLVITDIRMPQMSGLEMIERLRSEKCGSEFIILSGYSDFEYAKEAIRLGASDYLVKPVVLETLVEAINQVENKKYNAATYIPTAELLLDQLMQEETEEEKIVEQLAWTLQIPADRTSAVLLLHLNYCQKRDGHYQGFSRLIREKADELCLDALRTVMMPPEYGVLCIVSDIARMPKLKNMLLRYLLPEIKNARDCSIVYGEIQSLNQLAAKIRQMRQAMIYENIEGDVLMTDTTQPQERGWNKEKKYPYEMEQSVKNAIFRHDSEAFHTESQKLFDYFWNFSSGELELKEWFLRFWSMAGIQLYEFFNKNSYDVFDKLGLRQIISAVSGRELLMACRSMEKNVCDFFRSHETKQSYGRMVSSVMKYIEEHYHEHLDQKELANRLGVTPEYLSAQFSRETGVSFSFFIKEYRVRQAKYFLINTNMKIQDIGTAVGYHDAAYFNRLFRAQCQMTPLDYRKQYKKGAAE